MSWTLEDHTAVGFSNGAGGHAVSFPNGAVTAGWLIDVRVSSDDVTSLPSGYTQAIKDETNLGAYAFYKIAAGGETSVTITTGSNTPAAVCVTIWQGNTATPVDVTAKAVSTTSASTTPAVTTAGLAQTGELSLASGHLGGRQAAVQTGFSASAGYTVEDNGASAGTGVTDQVIVVAAKTNAGTAAESPSISWTNPTNNQTILVVTYESSGTSFSRTGTDSIHLADSPTRTAIHPRSTPDTLHLADSPSSHVARPRTGTDTLHLADSPARTVVLARATSDTLHLADSPSRTAIHPRSIADTLHLADAPVRVVVQTRAATDTLTLTDVPAVLPPTRDLVVTIYPPLAKWQVGGQMPTSVSTASLEYIRVPVAAAANGVPVDPTADSVSMAFVKPTATPVSGDWKTASWDAVAVNGTYYAQCLVGTGGAVSLRPGQYQVWLKVTDNPEVPAKPAGMLQVY